MYNHDVWMWIILNSLYQNFFLSPRWNNVGMPMFSWRTFVHHDAQLASGNEAVCVRQVIWKGINKYVQIFTIFISCNEIHCHGPAQHIMYNMNMPCLWHIDNAELSLHVHCFNVTYNVQTWLWNHYDILCFYNVIVWWDLLCGRSLKSHKSHQLGFNYVGVHSLMMMYKCQNARVNKAYLCHTYCVV